VKQDYYPVSTLKGEAAMQKKQRPPSYCHHKASGQARVRIDGRDHYLGAYGTPQSRERYEELIREWMLRNGNVDAVSLTIDELALRYAAHAKAYYRKNGEPTNEAQSIRAVLKLLIEFVGIVRVREFGPRRFREFRDWLVTQPDRRFKENPRTLSRQYVNRCMQKVVRAFKWGVSEGIIPVETWQALTTVDGLRKGRSEARESPAIKPVDDADVDAVLMFLAPPVRAMVELQRLTGMRPGEAIQLKPGDITRRIDGLWCYRPGRFKTEHHVDAERSILLGPKAQSILHPWLDRDIDSPCFSPHESVAWQRRQKRAKRQSKVQPSQQNRVKPSPAKPAGTRYTTGTYRQAIHYACKKAGINHWSPNQIRHTVATVIRQQFGLEAAQVTLGHARADVTQVYAERDQKRAAEVALAIG
jgi:integrase